MMKKLFPITMIVLVLGLLFAGIAFKDSMNNYFSKMPTKKYVTGIESSETVYIDSAFNYTKNSLGHQVTFLEFGSTSCSGCKKMEQVMKMVQENYPERVNVVFYNVNLKENFKMAEHFGIRMIPAQVLLDKNGIEFYRHNGYLSFNELAGEINKIEN